MSNKIALVTGASSGIGAATAQLLAQSGYTVYGTSRRGLPIDGQNFYPLALDVTSDSSVNAAISHIIGLHGQIDLLVNNAGVGVAPAAAEESSIQQAQAIFDTNFFGIVRMVRAVVPHMRQQKSGRIINIGSVLGFLPMPYMALYAATKHAVAGYSESLDHELRTLGIRVSVVEPAYTKTSFEANGLQPDAMLEDYQSVRVATQQLIQEMVENGDPPIVVAETILKIARAPQPKLRYTAGKKAAQLKLLRRYAPAPLLDKGLRKDLRLV
jgi:NAD(P)-dependent dehydrogenase (short-subunit alcohol dehydrogenase family)